MAASTYLRMFCAILAFATVFSAGCRRPAADSKADIQKAMQQYLAGKQGLSSAMDMEIQNVQFQGDTADADVLFRSKQNPQASMTMKYTLKRTGPGSWQVIGPKGAGGANPHGTVTMPQPSGPTPSPFGPPANVDSNAAPNPHAGGQAPPAKPGQNAPAMNEPKGSGPPQRNPR